MARLPRLAGPLLAVALASVLGACGAGVTPFAAVVNGSRIGQDQLVRELKDLAANKAFVTAYNQSATQSGGTGVFSSGTAKPTFTQTFVAAVLGLDVQAAVVHNEVLRRHIEPAASAVAAKATHDAAATQFDTQGQPSVFDKFSPWLRTEFQLRQAEQDALGKALGSASVTDADVTQFYNQNPGDFISSQCLAHILVKTQAQAAALRAQIVGGASFAAVAQQNSTDTATAAKGGSLGCGAPGAGTSQIEQDQTFQQAAVATPANQVSQPIQTTLGFDLLIVTNRQVLPLSDTVKQAIRQHLQQLAGSPLTGFFQQAATKLKVTINPEYGSWDTQQLKVVPPPTAPAKAGAPTQGTTGQGATGTAGQGTTGQGTTGQGTTGQGTTGQGTTGQGTTGQGTTGTSGATGQAPPTTTP